MKENTLTLDWAKQLEAGLKDSSWNLVWVKTEQYSIAVRHCRRGEELTGGLLVIVNGLTHYPWERPSDRRVYLRAGWDVHTLSRALFRLTQTPPQNRPLVLTLWRRVEEEKESLPDGWLAQVDAEMERTGYRGCYNEMTESEASHWLTFLDGLVNE